MTCDGISWCNTREIFDILSRYREKVSHFSGEIENVIYFAGLI
jgi:hypothetical protein